MHLPQIFNNTMPRANNTETESFLNNPSPVTLPMKAFSEKTEIVNHKAPVFELST